MNVCHPTPSMSNQQSLIEEIDRLRKEKNAVILGLGSYLEIWSEEAWKTESELESSEEIEDLMVALGC